MSIKFIHISNIRHCMTDEMPKTTVLLQTQVIFHAVK